MSRRRLVIRAIPWMVFVAAAIPAMIDVRDGYLAARYRSDKNPSAGIVRAYAYEFESESGRRPTLEELRSLALRRFEEDVRRFDFSDPVGPREIDP